VAFCLISVWTALIKYGGPLYKSWAESQNEKIRGILNAARADHSQAVKTRITDVQQMAGVVDITKSLFAVSKETATLEAQAFELEQKTAIAAEAKSVLDSWVRYEAQVKQRQQRELAESVIAKVKKELETPKSLQQILQQAVADVESKSSQRLAMEMDDGQSPSSVARPPLSCSPSLEFPRIYTNPPTEIAAGKQ
jgi:F-type H+-transporting ATPase subunit b